MNKPVKDVPSIPYDIDGTTVFKVKTKNNFTSLMPWKIEGNGKNDSRREWSGYMSFRYRDCSVGYTCPNTDCLFYKQFSYGNRTNFQNYATCEYCSALRNYTQCLARKYAGFSNNKEATFYHCGQHNCAAKEISKRSSYIVRNAITRDCSTTLRAIQSMSIIADLRSCKNW